MVGRLRSFYVKAEGKPFFLVHLRIGSSELRPIKILSKDRKESRQRIRPLRKGAYATLGYAPKYTRANVRSYHIKELLAIARLKKAVENYWECSELSLSSRKGSGQSTEALERAKGAVLNLCLEDHHALVHGEYAKKGITGQLVSGSLFVKVGKLIFELPRFSAQLSELHKDGRAAHRGTLQKNG